jgi:polar amino acid transport system substrate-binding protein
MQNSVLRLFLALLCLSCLTLSGCSKREKISSFQQLDGKEFAIPTGTVADQLVLSKLPNARFKYFNSGLVVMKEMITVDGYGIAVRPDDLKLKNAIDEVVTDLMIQRWFPKTGNPAPMPETSPDGTNGVLRLGTASVTEPFSFVDGSGKVDMIAACITITKERSKQVLFSEPHYVGGIAALIRE